jgi:ATP-dependent RNA helicase DeaD
MQRFRIEVGHVHHVKPGNIVGAIANEAGLDSKRIGRVDIRDDYSLVDLPSGMPADILQHLKGVWVVGQQLRIVEEGKPFEPPRKPGKLALGDSKPRTFKPASGKARIARTKPGKGPGHAFPPRKPFAKPRDGKGGKGKPRT